MEIYLWQVWTCSLLANSSWWRSTLWVKVYIEASLWSRSVRRRQKKWTPATSWRTGVSQELGLLLLLPHLEGSTHCSSAVEWASESSNWKLMLLLTIKIQVKFYGYLAVMEFPISNSLCLALTSLPWLLQGSIVTTILSCAQVSTMHSSMITFC